MCGIGGVLLRNSILDEQVLIRMSDTLFHRGPDDKGLYLANNKRFGLIHRRLSFIDLSESGRQPMSSEDGKIHIVLNGEIYNYKELRDELQALGCVFKTQTDTEVLINGYKIWNDKLPQYISGMFAFAILDEIQNRLFLVRDRFGIKPLYYALSSTSFAFASEIKAILSTTLYKKEIKPESLSYFLANRYIPSPNTIWKNIFKLPAATYLSVCLDDLSITQHSYYKPAIHNKITDTEEASSKFNQLLLDSLSKHLIADVRIGAFLSGGYDSSTLVCLMQQDLQYPTYSFSIGFKGWNESEHQYAKIVANSVGAIFHTEILDEIDLNEVKKLMWFYDEPIADISILPTYSVSKLASQYVKAVVSGEGADELLGGYWWHKPERFYYSSIIQKWFNKLFKPNFTQVKQHYIHAMSMGLFSRQELLKCLNGEFLKHVPEDPFSHLDAFRNDELPVLKQLQLLDIHTFMNELILTKVDRASMAHSLEVRVPFLDHPLVDFILSLSVDVYFDPLNHKSYLKNILKNRVPNEILNRPKQGFVGPDKFYMNYALYGKALLHGLLIKQGVINKTYLESCLHNKDHWRLWKLFVLENWWSVWMN